MKRLILLSFIIILSSCHSDNDDNLNDCIDENLIDINAVCTEEVQPVCGCDGRTYGNSCEAINWNGITEYVEGICPGDGNCKFTDCD